MSYRNQVAAVFGGSGFIGRHLIRRLARAGMTVRVAGRNPAHAAFLKTAGAVGQIVPMAVDITKDESLARVVAGADVVVNLIGALYQQGPWSFERVHAEAPGHIAGLARVAGVERVVHVSALGADIAAGAAYARTKAQGEKALLAAFESAVVLRPSIVFGPEDQFFNRFAAQAQVMPALPLIGGGTTRFQPVYVGDVADAIMAALEDETAGGKIFELCGPATYTFKELMELMLKEIHARRCLVPMPWRAAEFLGGLLEKVPFGAPMLTRDQVELLRTDNVCSGSKPGLGDLGVTPTALEVILPTYLGRFVKGGRFGGATTEA